MGMLPTSLPPEGAHLKGPRPREAVQPLQKAEGLKMPPLVPPSLQVGAPLRQHSLQPRQGRGRAGEESKGEWGGGLRSFTFNLWVSEEQEEPVAEGGADGLGPCKEQVEHRDCQVLIMEFGGRVLSLLAPERRRKRLRAQQARGSGVGWGLASSLPPLLETRSRAGPEGQPGAGGRHTGGARCLSQDPV